MADWQVIERLISKIERARKHILDLEAASEAFVNGGGYRIEFEDDSKKKERSYRLVDISPIPREIPLIIGDAVHNLRSALDHLAWYLVALHTPTGPFSHVYFPITKDAASYKLKAPRKVSGMRQDAIAAIDAIEPFGGGSGELLWKLHCLDNIDKHQLLLTVLSDLQFHSLLPSQRTELEKTYRGSYPGGTPPDLRGVLTAPKSKPGFPLRPGDILLTIPRSEMEEQPQFLISIAFGKPKVSKDRLLTRHYMDLLISFAIWFLASTSKAYLTDR